jgi:hypothetical protein
VTRGIVNLNTGTISLWAFSRFWWQRGGKKVIESKRDVQLPEILSLSSPGEGFDVIAMLRWNVFRKAHLPVLVQMFLIFLVTCVCTFAGPLAKVSLRVHQTLEPRDLEVLKAWKGSGWYGNSVTDNVGWNNTMTSLNEADFPHDQLLDYVPHPNVPWKYLPQEWDPSWRAACNFEDKVPLDNLEVASNVTLSNAINIFPAYKKTYDSTWLDESRFRIQSNYNGARTSSEQNGTRLTDVIFWFLIQSNPMENNRMFTNEGSMQISISALYVKSVQALIEGSANATSSANKWRLNGTIPHASYARMTCEITKKTGIVNNDSIPWLWTNDTDSISLAYRTNWVARRMTAGPPHPHEVFRFYQAYIAGLTAWDPRFETKKISVWTDTVQLSTVCLVMILVMVLLEMWLAGRYLWFLRGHRLALQRLCIPDGKIDWMVHNARLAEENLSNPSAGDNKTQGDRDYFQNASFGTISLPEQGIRPLARVYTNPALSTSPKYRFADVSVPGRELQNKSAQMDFHTLNASDSDRKEIFKQATTSQRSCGDSESGTESVGGIRRGSSDQAIPHQNESMLKPEVSETLEVTTARGPSLNHMSSVKYNAEFSNLANGNNETIEDPNPNLVEAEDK